MDTITLPDGTTATIIKSITWGELVLMLLLLAILLMLIYQAWSDVWHKREKH